MIEYEMTMDMKVALAVRHPRLLLCTRGANDTLIAEKVGVYYVSNRRVDYFEFDVTTDPTHEYKFRLHEFLVTPMKNGMAVENLVRSMIEVYDYVFEIEDKDRIADFDTIYGMKGTERENEVVVARRGWQ